MNDTKLEWQALLTYCKNHGLTVDLVTNKTLHDYAAMNEEAAKRIGYPIQKNHIQIYKEYSLARKIRDLKHELVERNLMREGDSYWHAHCIALKRESQRCKRMR